MTARSMSSGHLALAGLVLALGATAALAARAFVTIGTGDVTGVYYQAGGGICALVNAGRSDHQIRCTVTSSPGSVANIDALRRGERAFGFAQADLVQQAYTGSGAFAGTDGFDGLRPVLALHRETVTVVAGPDTGIASIQDLRDRRVNVGPPGSGQRASMQALMNALGWTETDFAAATERPASEQAAALCAGELDAVVFITGHPNNGVEQSLACGGQLVPVTGPAIERLVRGAPYYDTASIPAGVYRGVDEETPTYGVTAMLVSSTNTARATVFEVTNAIFERIDDFTGWHRALGGLGAAGVVDAPLHPGARMYYEDNDLL